MGKSQRASVSENKGALLVLVARVSRSEKIKELTSGWSSARWQNLCATLAGNLQTHSCLPEENLVLLPDLELHGTIARSQVRSLVREVFEQHRRHSSGSAIVVLNPFSADGIADAYFQHFLNLFITLHEMEGRVLMLRCEDLESVPT